MGARFGAAWQAGRGLSLNEAVDLGLARPGKSANLPGASTENLARLTRREREIATLIAVGRTNRQIAEALVISELTAETHVRNILSRLGFANRAQIASWATAAGLGPALD